MKRKCISGFVAATINEKGEVLQFTDPLPSRSKATAYINKHRSWFMSGDAPVRTAKFVGNPKHLYGFISSHKWKA